MSRSVSLEVNPPPYEVEIRAVPACELVLQVGAYGTPNERGTYDDDPRRLPGIRSIDPATRAAMRRLGRAKVWVVASSLPLELGTDDPADFVTALEGMDPQKLRAHLALSNLPVALNDVARQALDGDQAAYRELLRTAEHKETLAYFRAVYETPVTELHRQVSTALSSWWRTVFSPLAEELAPALRADAERLIDETRGRPPSEVVFQATRGLRLQESSDFRRVLLIPQRACRPWNWITGWRNQPVILCPSPADPEPSAAKPLLRLAKALGDERRLQILKLLAEQDMTFSEIVAAVGLAKSTTLHHLVTLRSVGLVVVELGEGETYRLVPGRLAELSTLIQGFLTEGTSPQGGLRR